MIDDQDLIAWKQHLQRPSQPQGVIMCMQQRRDGRHGLPQSLRE
jgi:hypothetical protein